MHRSPRFALLPLARSLLRRPSAWVPLFALFLASCGRTPPRPNVVLISVDTLRPDHLSAYGYPRKTSPFIDSLAARGARFTDCWSVTSWTRPAMASLFTGLHPRSHGVVTTDLIATDGTRWPIKIDPSFVTLAETLKANGYAAFGVSANPQAGVWTGSDQGFDVFIETGDLMDAEAVHRRLLSLRERLRRERPFFLWIFYYDPHAPYTPRSPWIEEYARHPALTGDPALNASNFDDDFDGSKSGVRDDPARRETLVDLYDSEIAYTDDFIRRLFAEVLPSGETLVILHADHGEEFLEHGQLAHGRTLYAQSVRIPLILADPQGEWAGKVVGDPTSILDIYPTILDCLKIPPPPGLQGVSQLDRLSGSAPRPSRPLACELEEEEAPRLQSLLRNGSRLIRGGGESNALERHLFDIARDPDEANDLLPGGAERAAALEAALEEWLRITPRFSYQRREQRWTPEAREKLRALGYLK